MLPSDELARELGVSMGTVRKALDNMEDERLVLRRQGRGTVVVDQAGEEAVNRFNNITDASGRAIGSDIELLRQTTSTANAFEQERLQLDARDTVLRSERLRRAQGRP
jgi:GntR family transcriptional regulator